MRLLRHWKMVLGLMAIFVAGVGTGVIGTVVLLHRIFTRPEPQAHWVDARLGDLEKHLKITPEQRAKIKPVVDRAGLRFREIGGRAFTEIAVAAREAYQDVARELNPEQKAEFDRLRPQVIAKLRELAQREISVRASRATQAPPPSGPAPPPTEPAPDGGPQR